MDIMHHQVQSTEQTASCQLVSECSTGCLLTSTLVQGVSSVLVVEIVSTSVPDPMI